MSEENSKLKERVRDFWQEHPCGTKFADAQPGSRRFYELVEAHRYQKEWHIPAAAGNLWTYGILLALLATVIPSFMLSEGMKRIGANNAAIVTSVGPVSTILQAHFVLGDPIFIEQVVGTLLVIGGVLLTGLQKKSVISPA